VVPGVPRLDVPENDTMPRSLGEFEQLLLFAVLDLREEAYGAAIRDRIEERSGRSPSPGAVYTGLDRLESKGLVRSWLADSTPERGGRRKKFYALEPEGAGALEDAWRTLTSMAEGLIPRMREIAARRDDA